MKSYLSKTLFKQTFALLICYIFWHDLSRNAHAQTPKTHKPVMMTECEGTSCGTWTFRGSLGDAVWPNGEAAHLSLKRGAGNQVLIHRVDFAGDRQGLEADYVGTEDNDGISGKFTSSWPGQGSEHWDSKTGNWYGMGAAVPKAPSVMRVCADQNDWNLCSTWTLVNGHYDGWREWGALATMTVKSFTTELVNIHRTDTGPAGPGRPGAGFTMDYRGTISASGNSILDGQAIQNGVSSPFRAYWGAALRELPPSKNPGIAQPLHPSAPLSGDDVVRAMALTERLLELAN